MIGEQAGYLIDKGMEEDEEKTHPTIVFTQSVNIGERSRKSKATIMVGASCVPLFAGKAPANAPRITRWSEGKLKTKKKAPCLSVIEGRFAGNIQVN